MSLHEPVDVEQLRKERPAARERQQTLREIGGDLGRRHGPVDHAFEHGHAGGMLAGDLEIAGDHR
jgi:hypothetical protein